MALNFSILLCLIKLYIDCINFIIKTRLMELSSSNIEPLIFPQMVVHSTIKKTLQHSYRKYKTSEKKRKNSNHNIVSSASPSQIKILSPDKNSARLINFTFDEQSLPLNQKSISRKKKKTNIGMTFAHVFAKPDKQTKERYAQNCKQFYKKAKGAKIITRFKYPIEDNNLIKKYMCIEKIRLPQKKLQRSASRLQNTENSVLMKSEGINLHTSDASNRSRKGCLEKIKQIKTSKSHRRNNSYAFPISRQQECNQQLDIDDLAKQKIVIEFPIRKPVVRKDYFVFGMSERVSQQNKMEYFRDYLWKINYSNSIHVSTPEFVVNPYKVYIGPGNNFHLIKSLMKKRFWWTIVEKTEDKNMSDINFVWTQLKQNIFYPNQSSFIEEQSQFDKKLLQKYSEQDYLINADDHAKIFGKRDFANWMKHIAKNSKTQQKITQKTYYKRLNLFKCKPMKHIQSSEILHIHNHLQRNFYIGNKKALFYHMRKYLQLKGIDPFTILPLTFHITKGVEDPEFKLFKNHYDQIEKSKNKQIKNIWIVKPGENTNRGNGITVCYSIDDVLIRLRGRERNNDGKLRTFIVQKYIQRPLLYQKRKFDIRHYMLITCINGSFKAYWYEQGYLRTSSFEYNTKCSKDPLIHLTNDAIQKKNENYGKFQKGNKLSYNDFQKYLQLTKGKKNNYFLQTILPKMKEMGTEAVKSTYSFLDQNRRSHNFELLGLDFMIDEDLNPWLIEINTNPCLQICSSLLDKIIPQLIDNVLKICIDPLFPPPQNWQTNKKMFFGDNPLAQNRFQLIFDEACDGQTIEALYNGNRQIDENMGKIEEDSQIFEDDGDQNWETSKK